MRAEVKQIETRQKAPIFNSDGNLTLGKTDLGGSQGWVFEIKIAFLLKITKS